jgi:hypothetical protein
MQVEMSSGLASQVARWTGAAPYHRVKEGLFGRVMHHASCAAAAAVFAESLGVALHDCDLNLNSFRTRSLTGRGFFSSRTSSDFFNNSNL